MPTIKIMPHEEICPEGKSIEVESGVSICDAALANEIEIEHACEKSCVEMIILFFSYTCNSGIDICIMI